MSVNFSQLRVRVVRPVLGHLGLDGAVAEALVLGTAAQESGGRSLAQEGGGPALGFFQIEPHTEADVWDNFLKYRPGLSGLVTQLLAPAPGRTQQLATNLGYSVAMCRLVYLRAPEKLPASVDPAALGRYWKTFYNTPQGKGTVDQFVANFQRLVAPVLA